MKRGVTLTGKVKYIPSHDEIRNIFNETYNVFYKKWKDISALADWPILMQEARELNKKYPYSLCQQILLELIEIIEDGFKENEELDVNTNN